MLIVPAVAEDTVPSEEHGDSSCSTPLHVDVFVVITAPNCWNRNTRVKPCTGPMELIDWLLCAFLSQKVGSLDLLFYRDLDWPLGPGCSSTLSGKVGCFCHKSYKLSLTFLHASKQPPGRKITGGEPHGQLPQPYIHQVPF